MILTICQECSEAFLDENDHGVCFGCKVKTLRFKSVDTGPSKQAMEKQAVQDARDMGIEPERYEPNPNGRKERKAKTDRELKKAIDRVRQEVRSG